MNDQEYGLSLVQKLGYTLLLVALSIVAVLVGPRLQAGLYWTVFLAVGLLLGVVSFFVSAGWTYKLTFTQGAIKIFDRRQELIVPTDRIGMLLKNGGFPFPTLWLVLRNAEVGKEIPAKGVEPAVREQIEAYQRRNPGKKLSIVQIPGGYLKSVSGFAAEVKRRIPPVVVDERLAK